ncbi:TlpA family protein disulfide reductase [Pedobacter sp. GSP4]|uniref:TlpA family protein disulfide reductase n=1 Tax=Pedobacter sp. GSP4 TaxID=3453716 RepID=UPI003EED555B
MKSHLYFIALIACLFASCDPAPATFNVETKNFGPNAVITIQSSENSETVKVENVTNGKQHFKVNVFKKGYAILRTEDGEKKRDYYFYLDKGNFDVVLDGADTKSYPFKSLPSKKGEEFKDFYAIHENLTKNLMDSLNIVEDELDHANPDNIMERAKKVDKWREKKIHFEFDAIKAFAKKFPGSELSLFLLERLGRADSEPVLYASIINSLDHDIKESRRGKELLKETEQASKMMAGSKMPEIEGTNPEGKKFDPKILKKVNLFICWTSYSSKSRENNRVLTSLYEKYKNKDVEFIGISFDKKRDWWVNVIKDDKLTWPQYADLKGAKSPNAKNLSNYSITYFFLTDKNGTVLSNNDLNLDFVNDEISKNLEGR